MAARRLSFDMFRMTMAVIWGLLSMKGVSAGITYPVRWAIPFRIEGLNQDGIPAGIHAVRLEVSDSIRFEYDHSKDDLLEVGPKGFIQRGPPIQKWTDGNTTITYSTPGAFYYTCSLLHRHLAGQFLMVIVHDNNIPLEPSSEIPIESPLPSNTVDGAAQPNSTLFKIDPMPMNGAAATNMAGHRATEYLKPAPQISPTTSATTSKELKPGEQQKVKTDHAQSPATTQNAAGHLDNKMEQDVQGSGSGESAHHPSSLAHENNMGTTAPTTTINATTTTTPQHPGHSQANAADSAFEWPLAGYTNGTNESGAKSSSAVHRGPTSRHSTSADERHEKSASAAQGGATTGHASGGDGREHAKSTAAVDGRPTAGHAGRDAKSADAAHKGPTAGQTTGGDEPHPAKSIAAVDGGPTPGKSAGGNGSHAKFSGAVQGGPASRDKTVGDELQAKANVDQKSPADGYREANGSADSNAN